MYSIGLHRLAGLGVLALALGAALLGCGGDTEAPESPTATPAEASVPGSPAGPPDFGLPPMPEPEKLASMTPEQWAEYLSQGDAAMQAALLEGYRRAQENPAPESPDPEEAKALSIVGMRDAAAAYKNEHQEFPTADGHFDWARGLDAAGYQERALVHYRKAVDKDPAHAMAWAGLGRDLTYTGKHDEAIAAYRRALELAPDRPGWHKELGQVFENLARFDEALASYRRAVELKPDYGEGYLRMAVVQWRAKDYPAAQESLANAHRLGAEPPPGFADRLAKDAAQ